MRLQILGRSLASRSAWEWPPAIGEERALMDRGEKIRAGWIYYGDGADKLRFFKEQGMNALITSTANAETFDMWAKEAKRAGMRLFGVLGFSFDARRRRPGCAAPSLATATRAPSPALSTEEFWQQADDRAGGPPSARQGMDGEREISRHPDRFRALSEHEQRRPDLLTPTPATATTASASS